MTSTRSLSDFIVTFLFPHEGEVWENDPDDTGNIGDGKTAGNVGTRYGIDAHSHPGVNIRDLTGPDAMLIYEHEFYTSLANSLNFPLSLAFFDVHVNCGEIRAIKILQSILGVAVDGIVGPQTIGEAAICSPKVAALLIPSARDRFYESLGESVPTDRKYVRGWENRDRDLAAWIRAASLDSA